MPEIYVYVRKTGLDGTKVMGTSIKKAISIIRSNKGSQYQIGMLGGDSIDDISCVYGEFRPYYEVSTEAELLEGLN